MNSIATPENPAEAASVLMKRGIALLNESTPGSLAEAVTYFDRALALRRALQLDESRGRAHPLGHR
jgi:hypothetical protein